MTSRLVLCLSFVMMASSSFAGPMDHAAEPMKDSKGEVTSRLKEGAKERDALDERARGKVKDNATQEAGKLNQRMEVAADVQTLQAAEAADITLDKSGRAAIETVAALEQNPANSDAGLTDQSSQIKARTLGHNLAKSIRAQGGQLVGKVGGLLDAALAKIKTDRQKITKGCGKKFG
jgi:uncharacterized protein YukE